MHANVPIRSNDLTVPLTRGPFSLGPVRCRVAVGSKRSAGLGLPLSALVMGALAPDAPVYLPVGVSYQTTHSGWGVAVDGASAAGTWPA